MKWCECIFEPSFSVVWRYPRYDEDVDILEVLLILFTFFASTSEHQCGHMATGKYFNGFNHRHGNWHNNS